MTDIRKLINLLEEIEKTPSNNLDLSNIDMQGDIAQTLVNLIALIDYLGSVGSSRSIEFSVDGDGADRLSNAKYTISDEVKQQMVDAVDTGKPIVVGASGFSTTNKDD